MRDEDKTKQQLLDELVQLRRRVAELERLNDLREHLAQKPLRIGEILLEMGYATIPQLEEALQKQKELTERGQSYVRLASLMFKLGFINADQMSSALSLQEVRIRDARLELQRTQDEIRRWNR